MFIDDFNNVFTLISFFSNVALLIPFIVKGYNYFTQKRYIKKVLGYSNEEVLISHGLFYLQTYTKNKKNWFITYAAVQAMNHVINLFNRVEQRFILIENAVNSKNEMHIGGFLVNKKVNSYFIKHFPNFKYIESLEKKENYIYFQINESMIEFSTEKKGFQVGNTFLDMKDKTKDYAFLIKMVEQDFKDDKRTVHMLFGGGDIGTIKAAEYFSTHYKQIYDKYKKGHYFFVLEINCIDNSINYAKGIMDFTDEMF